MVLMIIVIVIIIREQMWRQRREHLKGVHFCRLQQKTRVSLTFNQGLTMQHNLLLSQVNSL